MKPITTPWLSAPVRRKAPRLRLFCFPYAGGSATAFRDWHALLPEELELVAVQLPGRENRYAETPSTDLKWIVEALASAIAPHLDLPYACFGHSLGTLLSYELVREVQRRGLPPPVHVVMSGRGAPHLSRQQGNTHLLPDAEFIAELREMQGTPEEVLGNPEMMRLLLPSLRADFALAAQERSELPQLLPCGMSVYGGLGDAGVPRAHLQEWQHYCAKPIRLRLFPGGHFFLHSARFTLLQALVRDVWPPQDAVAQRAGR